MTTCVQALSVRDYRFRCALPRERRSPFFPPSDPLNLRLNSTMGEELKPRPRADNERPPSFLFSRWAPHFHPYPMVDWHLWTYVPDDDWPSTDSDPCGEVTKSNQITHLSVEPNP